MGFDEMEIMEQQEELVTPTPLPVLPRLDRLDRLLQLLEEKHTASGRHLCDEVTPKVEKEDPRKSLSSALEEVHHKGTLIERLTMLENRVLQLSSEMDEANTSRSSSSTNNPVFENFGHDSISSTVTMQEEEKIVNPQEKQDPAAVDQGKKGWELWGKGVGVGPGRLMWGLLWLGLAGLAIHLCSLAIFPGGSLCGCSCHRKHRQR